MKTYVLAANENWICDRFAKEWAEYYSENTNDIDEAGIVWLLSPWIWKNIPQKILKEKKVLVTIHHIVPDKFDEDSLQDFKLRDNIVDAYHVPCEQTKAFISDITNKPIHVQPFWANDKLWHPEEKSIRDGFGFDEDAYLIGSFQRDTEGHDLKTPKLEKGPDIFCDIVEEMYEENKKIEVVLAGWRRQYVIGRLEEAGIKYHYFELPPFDIINKLYNCLDLYIVASRTEGGPQSIVECALTKTPIISTPVGIAYNILSDKSVYPINRHSHAKPDVDRAYENVQKYVAPHGYEEFVNILGEVNGL